MRTKNFLIFIFIMISLLYSAASYAAGVGGYFTTHYGSYKWDIGSSLKLSDSTFGGADSPERSMPLILGGGVVWDTNLASDKILNFRQNIGFEYFDSSKVRMQQYSLFNTIGFSPVRTELLRFWFGPQFNIQYRRGKDAHSYYTPSVMVIVNPWAFYKIKREYDFISMGTGIALGLNLNVHKNVTIGLEMGVQISKSVWGTCNDIEQVESSYWAYEGYVSVSILGRFNDEYNPSR